MAGNSWKSINWKDPFLLEQQLTDDQRLVERHRTSIWSRKAFAWSPGGL